MSENNQAIYVFLYKTSKESINDFIKQYLENSENTLVLSEDDTDAKFFKIYEYESYIRDHNLSGNSIKPQFSFLFPRYYLTIMVDLTTSMFTTTNDGDVKIEKGLEALKDFLNLAVKNYEFNNGLIKYVPEVIVNVLCFSNNRISVIIKGWELKLKNYQQFNVKIFKAIYKEMTLESVSSTCETFFSVLREGIIALNLFEDDKRSLRHLLIVTDGQYPITDGICLDRCLLLLRHCNICCSFIHVKTASDSLLLTSITDQGHDDQLRFIANATGGFYKTTNDLSLDSDRYVLRYRYFDQSDFVDAESMPIKNFTDRNINAPPMNLIFTVINMGYFLNSVNTLRDSRMEVELILPWRCDVYIKITILSKVPIEQQKKCWFSLSIFGQNYHLYKFSEFIVFDSNVIDQSLLRYFRGETIKEIKFSLYNIQLFSQFNQKQICMIPNFINNGLKPMLSPTNQPCDKINMQSKSFFDFWTKTLDFTYLNCFHTSKIHILIEHDYPFPDYLSGPDPLSKTFGVIQGRESLVQLSGLINKNFCTFIVKENNTYVKFFLDNINNVVPSNFCVLKMCCQGLYVKLLLHFFITTPEKVRDDFVISLINKISVLKFQPRGKQARPRHMSNQITKNMEHVPPQQRSWEQINCCTVLSLDLSNLIAMHNPIKSVDGCNNIIRRNKMSLSLLYLHNHCHHEYRIWAINDMFMKNIFETLIKLRIQEGFHIAVSDSSSGFINLIKELRLSNNEGNVYNCFIQYLIYPDNTRHRKDSDNVSMLDDDPSCRSLLGRKIYTEILIEKKYGKVIFSEPEVIHWEGLSYEDIPGTINELDLKTIEAFVTFECFKIYPMTLPRGLVKPNICSVLNKSPRLLLHCPLFMTDCADNFNTINSVFMDLLDSNLKRHGFNHIDITKTENGNFNKLILSYNDYKAKEETFDWNCYYSSKVENLIVLMVPNNYLHREFEPHSTNDLPIIAYGMSLKHISFLIEDCWTLKLPISKQFSFPLDSSGDLKSFESKALSECDKVGEFSLEMERLDGLLMKSVVKLESIYLLTFVGGVHKNLREDRQMDRLDLHNTFSKYCSELSFYDVDSTKFINTICSHCLNALKLNPIQSQSNLGFICKENCEIQPGMHDRIIKRIRQMMAKYFKEVPSFSHILLYCPENELESSAHKDDTDKIGDCPSEFGDELLCRQKSLENQCSGSLLEQDFVFTDSVSEAKSVSSIRLVSQSGMCPLFISINYTLKYDKEVKYLKFDSIPTCISDFIGDIRSMVCGDVNFQKLKFNLDLIPITYLDEDLSSVLTRSKNEDQSLMGEVNSGSKRCHTEISKRYLTPVQTQLLDRCKTELTWTLDDEVVNCLKYFSPIDGTTIDMVKKHIENTSTMKLQKNFGFEIQNTTFDLDFVFDFEKSKSLFNKRFEKITFGKDRQYRIDKIDDIYCVFQKRSICPDQSALIEALFEDMDEIFINPRLRVDSLCLKYLQSSSDDMKIDYIRRCSSEGKLTDMKSLGKMGDSKREYATLFDKTGNALQRDQIKSEINPDSQTGVNMTCPINLYNVVTYNARQYRSPLLINNQQSSSQTPRRHRSGEASSVAYTCNYRSDTPMQLNDLVSTATSSKGYEGDSSRVSDGEEYDRFSNCPTDNKMSSINQFDVAPFWLLLKVVESCKYINVYFHHTDTCTAQSLNTCEHCISVFYVREKINECVREVNQCLLLEKLAQTRICRDILVPEISQDSRSSHANQLLDCDYDDDNSDCSKKFDHGAFSCPLIRKITFKLHPRLKRAADNNSKAIPALRMSLENIVILNRKNMLIFIDENTSGIFYALLHEVSKELTPSELDQLNDNSVLISEQTDSKPDACSLDSDNLSSKSTSIPKTSNLQAKTMDLLELSIHGIDKLSDATVKSIIANITSKLDSIVLKNLSDAISRSWTNRLCKEDLDFLLRTDYNDKPQRPTSFFWSLPKLVVENSLAFCYYLKQNLQLTFISPKLADAELYERFNLNSGMVGEIYLYNQSSAQGVANDAIVLLTAQLLSTESFTSWKISDYSIPELQQYDDLLLTSIIDNNQLREIDEQDVAAGAECCIKFGLWLRGHVEIDVIKRKIYNIVQYSINDLLLEFVIIPRPISTIDCNLLTQLKASKSDFESFLSSLENGENGTLQRIYSDDLFTWFPELCKSENPLIKYRKTEMFSDFNVEFLINDLVEGLNDPIIFSTFCLHDNSWIPWNSKQPKSGKDYPCMKRSFILIGRIQELWKRFVSKKSDCDLESSDLNLSISQSSQISNTSGNLAYSRTSRMLLKLPPFENNSQNSITSSTSTTHTTSTPSQNLPEFCHVQVERTVVIPRQMLCIIKISGCQIDTISYNLAKESIDNLNNLMDNIVKNHKARFQMLNSFIYQKLGLFHDSMSISCSQNLNINVVKNLSQIVKVKNCNLNIADITRDRKPSGSPRSFSPSNRIYSSGALPSQGKSNNRTQAAKKIQLSININRIFQDPYTIFAITDVKKLDSINDIIYLHASQFLATYNLEMKRRLFNKKVRQCLALFQPNQPFNQSESSDILCPLEQLDVFSSMKRACRIFHSVVCPILFIPHVRKKLLNLSIKQPASDTGTNSDDSSPTEDWMNVMSVTLLGYYAEYVQKEHGFSFVNPPRPNVTQNPCSHALFQKLISNSGVYLMEVFILKGCLCVRLSAFECRRLRGAVPGLFPSIANFQPIQQPQKTFVKDACKMCDLTHLFSFIYDFYVGMVVKSITCPEENKRYFNVMSFLKDFVRMYSYPPMYACNHIYWMPFPVTSDLIKPNDLFEFLVRHYEDYGFMLSHNISDQSSVDVDELFVYNISDEPFICSSTLDIKTSISPSPSPLNLLPSAHNTEDKHHNTSLECDFTSIFCLTKSADKVDSTFDLFIVTFDKSNSFPHQFLIPITKSEPNMLSANDSIFYPAKYLSILPHKSSSPDNMLHLANCPISINSIDTGLLPHSLAWKTFDNRSVVPLQIPLFLTLKFRIENYMTQSDTKIKRAMTDCYKDSLWQRMYKKPDANDSTKFSLHFNEFQDLINSGDIVDILELDPRLIDSMKIAAAYLKELDKCMRLLSEDCCTILYENAFPIYKSTDKPVSTHLVLMSKNTMDGFLLLSKTQEVNSEDNVELKAVFRSQDCRNRVSPQSRYFSSTLRDVTVMLAETAAFCIWRKLTGKL